MVPLPSVRQMMSPVFYEISLDEVGPIEIKDIVNKHKWKKVCGIIFTCLATKAMHLDIMEDMVQNPSQRKENSHHPANIHSNKGSQLMNAADELKAWTLNRKIEYSGFNYQQKGITKMAPVKH